MICKTQLRCSTEYWVVLLMWRHFWQTFFQLWSVETNDSMKYYKTYFYSLNTKILHQIMNNSDIIQCKYNTWFSHERECCIVFYGVLLCQRETRGNKKTLVWKIFAWQKKIIGETGKFVIFKIIPPTTNCF